MLGFVKRFVELFTLFKYDFIYIHREATPIGPPVIEWLIAKVFRKKIIYDFDDAIWVSVASIANPGVAALKCTWKVANICRMSYIVTVGNEFLATWAKQYCEDVRFIPTVVDTNQQHNRQKDQEDTPLVIGWTGTFTNFYNLKKITQVIAALKEKYNFTFLIIADKDPNFDDVTYAYKKWQIESEIDDLLQMHIGVMPLDNTEIELGKCAFKAIQYMSLGIPSVVSPVGANCVVIENHVNGFWAANDSEWRYSLEHLLKDTGLRKELGAASRLRAEKLYSVDATKNDFFGLFLKTG